MKKVILSLGMLIAVATATFAQSNTSTLIQSGDANTATMDQKGQNNAASIVQVGASTTHNKASITQTGKNGSALISESGTFNDASIKQDNTAVANHTAVINVIGSNSDMNIISVTQAGKGTNADVEVQGDANGIIVNQSGDTNLAKLFLQVGGDNDANTVTITQAGKENQSFSQIVGDENTLTINQNGNANQIGTFGGGFGPALSSSFTRTRIIAGPSALRSLTPLIGGADGSVVSLAVNAGVNVIGDRNIIAVTQGANTRNNFVGVELAGTAANGANNNAVSITQSDNAEDNQALVAVSSGQDRNTSVINQTGFAQFNRAGIFHQGSDDFATINQSGKNNVALTNQLATTTSGSNFATINQPGNGNTAYIQQDGVYGSTATITQNTNGHVAEIYQTGNGQHVANLVQESLTGGSRFILEQTGTRNTVDILQKDISGQPTDVEFRQTGIGNTITGINTAGTTRYTQTGINNSISF